LVELDTSGWSGEGTFTQALLDFLKDRPEIRFVKVEDAPASRSDAAFIFISNELYVAFAAERQSGTTIGSLASILERSPEFGAPDYQDDEMLQYLRTERIIPPYQTRGYKLIELVRIYRVG
jgi:hypothetical protein